MRDVDLQDPRVSAIERDGSPIAHYTKPTFQADELIQVVEISDEEYTNIVAARAEKRRYI